MGSESIIIFCCVGVSGVLTLLLFGVECFFVLSRSPFAEHNQVSVTVAAAVCCFHVAKNTVRGHRTGSDVPIGRMPREKK